MPTPRKHELIQCTYFSWRLLRRKGVYYADGRPNQLAVGRHSLGTRDKDEARRRLVELDKQRAIDFELIPAPVRSEKENTILTLEDGRRLYEEHLARTRVLGGVWERLPNEIRKAIVVLIKANEIKKEL